MAGPYYVDGDVGNDGNLGTSEGAGNAWATIDHAMNQVAAGEIVYVKSSATYNEVATIDTVGTFAAPVYFIGYTTVAARSDRGKATIDGQDARANCLADSLGAVGGYYVFENFKFIQATGNGVSLSLNQMTFRNCEFNDNAADGLNVGNGLMAESCIFDTNGSDGAVSGTTSTILGCRFVDQTAHGASMDFGTVWGSVFYNIGSNAINFVGSNGFACAVINCTIDGNAKATGVGIQFSAAFWGPYSVINTIVYDCTTGIAGHNGGGRFIGRNNLLNANTADYGNAGYETLPGEVTDAPLFENEGAQDYTLGSASPAFETGFDGYETAGATQAMDIGAHESTLASGGGLSIPNKRAGKQ